MRLIEANPVATILLNVTIWPAIHFIAGYAASRRKRASFDPKRGIYRLNRLEADGKLYERLGVKRWKDRLPDFGDFFKPGFRKKELRSRNREYLETFYLETCRAEFAHWMTIACVPIFALWNEWWILSIMLGYALLANLPCIIIQRYNRARLFSLLRIAE